LPVLQILPLPDDLANSDHSLSGGSNCRGS
jgi:hypothetical protein